MIDNFHADLNWNPPSIKPRHLQWIIVWTGGVWIEQRMYKEVKKDGKPYKYPFGIQTREVMGWLPIPLEATPRFQYEENQKKINQKENI